jgi:hypothetical protein
MFNSKIFKKNPNYTIPIIPKIKVDSIDEVADFIVLDTEDVLSPPPTPRANTEDIVAPKPKRKYVRKNKTI